MHVRNFFEEEHNDCSAWKTGDGFCPAEVVGVEHLSVHLVAGIGFDT
jgi:hypothetical protein